MRKKTQTRAVPVSTIEEFQSVTIFRMFHWNLFLLLRLFFSSTNYNMIYISHRKYVPAFILYFKTLWIYKQFWAQSGNGAWKIFIMVQPRTIVFQRREIITRVILQRTNPLCDKIIGFQSFQCLYHCFAHKICEGGDPITALHCSEPSSWDSFGVKCLWPIAKHFLNCHRHALIV